MRKDAAKKDIDVSKSFIGDESTRYILNLKDTSQTLANLPRSLSAINTAKGAHSRNKGLRRQMSAHHQSKSRNTNRLAHLQSMQNLTTDASLNITDAQLKSDFGALKLKEVASMYHKHNSHEFFGIGIKGYSITKQEKSEPDVADFKGTYVKYHQDIKPKPREYIHRVIEKAKAVPDPRKYSHLKIWTEKCQGTLKW